MKRLMCVGLVMLIISNDVLGWGFYGHKLINYQAVFLLPPEMLRVFKANINFLQEHAVDPDKRRYLVPDEGPRHYIDMDRYGLYPFSALPRKWNQAVEKFGEDSLRAHGVAPWWIDIMMLRLTNAFRDKDLSKIMKLAAETGHYLADIHVPLHTSSNHNGQFTNQHGIHGFWESRIPELFAEKDYDLWIGRAEYLSNTSDFVWNRILESSLASDSVLRFEAVLSTRIASDRKYSFEERNGVIIKQYSSAYCEAYEDMLNGMVERRMRQSIYAVASFWYTAWVNAGQPSLSELSNGVGENDQAEWEILNRQWSSGSLKGRACE